MLEIVMFQSFIVISVVVIAEIFSVKSKKTDEALAAKVEIKNSKVSENVCVSRPAVIIDEHHHI